MFKIFNIMGASFLYCITCLGFILDFHFHKSVFFIWGVQDAGRTISFRWYNCRCEKCFFFNLVEDYLIVFNTSLRGGKVIVLGIFYYLQIFMTCSFVQMLRMYVSLSILQNEFSRKSSYSIPSVMKRKFLLLPLSTDH